MESGLEDRNNKGDGENDDTEAISLNGVRPRRPEQYHAVQAGVLGEVLVSMESGLEDRNNTAMDPRAKHYGARLNGVRPRRPEQSALNGDNTAVGTLVSMESGLEDRNNAEGTRSWVDNTTDVSMESGLEDRNNETARAHTGSGSRLNGVRPRRPEQCWC